LERSCHDRLAARVFEKEITDKVIIQAEALFKEWPLAA
jgi:hypothetical protein